MNHEKINFKNCYKKNRKRKDKRKKGNWDKT